MQLHAILAMVVGSGLALASMKPLVYARQDSGDSESTTSTATSTTRTVTSGSTLATAPSISQLACVSSIRSLILSNSASPTAPTGFESAIASIASSFYTGSPDARATDASVACQQYKSFTNLPFPDGPIKTAFDSYITSYISYASASASVFSSLARECIPSAGVTATRRLPEGTRPEEFWAGAALIEVATNFDQCVTAVEVQRGLRTGLAVPAPSGSGAGSGGSGGQQRTGISTSKGGAAGPRETGYAFAAAAAAGVVGAMGAF